MLQHEILVIFYWVVHLLLLELDILLELELELVNEGLCPLLVVVDAGAILIVPVAEDAGEEGIGLEVHDWLDDEEAVRGVIGRLLFGYGEHAFEGYSVGVHVELGVLAETADVDHCSVVQVTFWMEQLVHYLYYDYILPMLINYYLG